MKGEDCWMSFSEAFEDYLEARDASRHYGAGRNRDIELAKMKVCCEHMDALTSKETS